VSSGLVYVYAIVSRAASVQVEGIDGAPVRWVSEANLAAAVSDVPTEDFGEQALNDNVRDMGWLGPRAVAHQNVNAALFDASDAIIPLAFGTVFRDDTRVCALLAQQSEALSSRLARVRGCAEWVVALIQVRAPDPDDIVAANAGIQQLRDEIASSSPGRAHLLRQRLQTLERDEARRIQSQAGALLLDALRAIAVEVYQEPLPADADFLMRESSSELDSHEKPLLRASVLVRRDGENDFIDAVDGLRGRWREPTYRLLLTGPWPPYRFAGLSRAA
jgi:gas vesicle protein GvpL/GvpF